jgi:hypothetical protein
MTLQTLVEGQKIVNNEMRAAQQRLEEDKARLLADKKRAKQEEEDARADIHNRTLKLRDLQRMDGESRARMHTTVDHRSSDDKRKISPSPTREAEPVESSRALPKNKGSSANSVPAPKASPDDNEDKKSRKKKKTRLNNRTPLPVHLSQDEPEEDGDADEILDSSPATRSRSRSPRPTPRNTRSRSRSPRPTPRTPSPRGRKESRTPTADMSQSRLDYSSKPRESSSRNNRTNKVEDKVSAKFDLNQYHAKASQPATFDHLGITAYGERSIIAWSTRMSYKTSQIKYHRKALRDLQAMLVDLSDTETEIHKRLLVGAP